MPALPRRAGTLIGVVLTTAVLVGASPGLAQDDPTSEEVAIASMLRAEDVAPATSDDEVSISSPEDLPGYVENGGLREVSRTWFSEEPTLTVFDFRWQFPDAESAAAFLDASEEVLSEVSGGAERGMLLLEPLPGTRFYTYEDRILGTGTVGYNFLMATGNLAAKVYVAGTGETLTQEQATAIAQAAAARMTAATGGGAPTSSAAPASPAASASPADREAALAELLSHVPAAVSESCAEVTDESGPASDVGEVAEVRCPMADGATLTFVLYGTEGAMDAAYDTAREYARIFGSFSSGTDCATGSQDGTWSVGGEEAGRLLCHQLEGAASIVWSHPSTRILSIIRQPETDHSAAWDLWLIAGPE
jgi:hypothetical protein